MAVAAPYETTDHSVAVGDRDMQKRITNLIASRKMWFAHYSTRGWGEKTPFTKNDLIPESEKFTVSLPSIDKWLTANMMALRKPTGMADFPVELVRISF